MVRKYLTIAELKPGARLEGITYLLSGAQLRPKKDGGNFAALVLRDATGKANAVMWDGFDAIASGAIKENDFVEIHGDTSTYNGGLQFRISKLTPVHDNEVETERFLPNSPRVPAEMDAELETFLESIGDRDLHRLTRAVFDDPDFRRRFRRAPAASTMHQAYLGGLIEHTLCVACNARALAACYPEADLDLLTAGALLHDIGKVAEYSYDRKIGHTDAGRMLGHISMGNAMVEVRCSQMPDLPPAKKVAVQHLILTHHGQREYGSPQLPATLEALILHHADQLDAQASAYNEWRKETARTGVRWERHRMFEGRPMFGQAWDAADGGEILREVGYAAPVIRR